VDDELAAADHDRHVAEIHLFLNRLVLAQPQPDAERPAVSQAELPALCRIVPRLAQLVADGLETELLVVALDREDFAQNPLQAPVAALLGRRVELEEALVRARLDVSERRDVDGVAEAAEVPRLRGANGALRRDGHSSCFSQKGSAPAPPGRRVVAGR